MMTKLVYAVKEMSTQTYMNINSQGHSLTLVQGHSDSTFSNIFSLETAGPVEAKFHVEPPWDGGTNYCSNGPGHMTNMAAILGQWPDMVYLPLQSRGNFCRP